MVVRTAPMEQMSMTVRIEKFIRPMVLKGFSVNPISSFAMVGDVLTCHQGAMVALIVPMEVTKMTVHRLKSTHFMEVELNADTISLFVMFADVLMCLSDVTGVQIALMDLTNAIAHQSKLSPTIPKRFCADAMISFATVADASTHPESVMVTTTVLTEPMSTTARTEKFQVLTTLMEFNVPLSSSFVINGDVLTSR